MPLRKKELPDKGELVVGTVKEVYDYGAYLYLDEYGIEAFLPWSEIATRWVRSIYDAVRPNQKVVVKVLRVHPRRKSVDVSLKRVSPAERRRRMAEWKRTQKAVKILEITAKKIGKSLEEAYEKVAWPIEENYGDLMSAFEEAAIRGPDVLRQIGVDEEWIEPLYNEIKRHVKVKRVKITGILKLQSFAGDGVERIKKVIKSAEEAAKKTSEEVEVKVYTIGAPRYRVELTGYDYKTLEKALSALLETARAEAENLGVELEFTREEE